MLPDQPSIMGRLLGRLKSWEGFLLLILLVIIVFNSVQTPAYLSVGNQINLFVLSIEKIIVVLIMTFIIINAEIDLSVASMMGLAACTLAWLHELGTPSDALRSGRGWRCWQLCWLVYWEGRLTASGFQKSGCRRWWSPWLC